jgi:hypothetical protein
LRTYVVRHVGVHDEAVSAGAQLEAIHVGAAEAELALAREDYNAGLAVDFLQLLGHLLSAIGGVILDDDELVVKVAARRASGARSS